jgi:spermidine synthase
MMGFLLFRPEPARIVMIGLGGGSLAKYCHSRLPDASVVVTEINPHVLALRDLFYIPPDDERFQVLREDGAAFVRRVPTCVDVLLVDGFDANGQSAQLCTQAFYEDCYRSLTPEGLMVINLPVDDPFLGRSMARVRRTFKSAVFVESADCANRVAFASRGTGLELPFEHLCARLGALERAHSVDLRDTLARIRYEQHRSGEVV